MTINIYSCWWCYYHLIFQFSTSMDNTIVNILVPRSLYLSVNIPVGQIPRVRVAGSERIHINILNYAITFSSKSNLYLLQPIESHCSLYFKTWIHCLYHSAIACTLQWKLLHGNCSSDYSDWNSFSLFWLEFLWVTLIALIIAY